MKKDILKSCDYLSSSRTANKINNVIDNLQNLKILYLTPERLINPEFSMILIHKGIKVSLIAVDEAHCVSLWGNTFRPSYLKIHLFLKHFPEAVTAAFTATATPEITEDIIRHLYLKNPVIFKKSSFRENIKISVSFIDNKIKYLLNRLDYENSTIIYTTSKYMCNNLSYLLESSGFSSTIYHAGLTKLEREANQDLFISGRKNIIIATSAFGMGIDKKDIRKIFHFDIPIEIEEYYQEIGRAGRDGQVSEAEILVHLTDYKGLNSIVSDFYPEWKDIINLFNKKDLKDVEKDKIDNLSNMLGIDEPKNIKKFRNAYLKKRNIAFRKVLVMKRFISSSSCRTGFIRHYFGEAGEDCGICDYCLEKKAGFHKKKLDQIEKKLISCFSPNNKFDIDRFREIIIGYKTSDSVNKGYGALSGLDIKSYFEIIDSLKNRGIVEFDENLKIGISKDFYKII